MVDGEKTQLTGGQTNVPLYDKGGKSGRLNTIASMRGRIGRIRNRNEEPKCGTARTTE